MNASRVMELSLFGGFQLIDDTGAAVELRARKTKALLAWLALHQEKSQPRERLALLLWEESGDAQARHSLRQALSGLRKVLGVHADALVTDQESVLLKSGHIVSDSGSFDALLKEAQTPEQLTRLTSLYGGEFLEGFNPRSNNFEEWLMTQRSHYRELAINTMSKLLAHYLQTAQLESGIRLGIKLLVSDPLQEQVHRTLMQLYTRLNRPADALRQYRRCRRLLMRELGVSPEPETEQLHEQIVRQRSREDDDNGAVDTGRIPSLEPAHTHATSMPADQPPQQMRTVTVAHLHLGSYPELMARGDPESLHALNQQLLELLKRHITQYGGLLHHQHGDAISILFGLEKAYGNECEKALQLLLELRSLPDAATECLSRLGARSGIATGTVMSDGCGAVSGAVFAQAEQLARSAAAGDILLTGSAYLGLRMSIEAVEVGDSNWNVSAILPETVARSKPFPFVGRTRELRQLDTALEACIEDRAGETFLLRGESGIGKTRLVDEIAQHALQMGVTPHRALVLDFGMESTTEPIPSLLRQLMGLDSSATTVEIEPAAKRSMNEKWNPAVHPGALLRLFRLPIDAGRAPALDSLSEEALHKGARQILQSLLTSATQSAPCLLIVEDIHWADQATLTHLAELADAVSRYPALLIITSRVEGEPLEPAWRSAMRGAPLTTLDLRPLPRDQAQRLAQQVAQQDQAYIDRCIERSGGNPFFLEQLLLGATDREGRVPDSIQSLVLSRLDLLSDEDRQAVQGASVLGQRFKLDLLVQLLGNNDYRPDALLNLRLLQPEGEGYLFVHALLRDAIYESLLPSQRRALHLRAAAWYQHRDPALHARHLDLGGNEGAAEAYLRAAQQAVAMADFEQALSMASRGAEIAQPAELGAQLNCLQGELLIQGGAIPFAIQAFAAAADKTSDDSTRCRAMIGKATGLTVQDDLDQALAVLDKAAPMAELNRDGALLTELHYRRGDILFALARTDDCLRAHRAAESLARQSDNPLLEIRALAGMADAYYAQGRIVTAQDYFERCLALAKRAHRLPQEIGNLSMYGVTLLYTGSIPQALETLHEAAELAAAYSNMRAEMTAYMNLSLVYLYTDDIDAAEHYGQRGLALARQLRASRFYGDNLAQIGEAMALKGNLEEGVSYLERAYRAALDSVPTHIAPYILGVLARVTDDEKQRQDAIREGQRYLDRGSLSHNYLHFYQNMIEVYLQREDAEKMLYYADALAEYTRKEPLPWSDFYIERGRLLAQRIRGEGVPELARKAKRLLDEATAAGLHAGTSALREITAAGKDQPTR
ncbi:MAG: AAA family ATPase [Candidatus Thiodiazotropha sp. (ex Ctena orbiculata)]|nr:AAA family ATPase [Candidatus Thiodiazotropha taylori]